MSSETTPKGGTAEVSADRMEDEMIARASVPNLASLFKQGKDAGLIKPTTGYPHEG